LVALGGEAVVDYSLRLKKELAQARSGWGIQQRRDGVHPLVAGAQEGGYEGASSMIYYGLPAVWGTGIEEAIVTACGLRRRRCGPPRGGERPPRQCRQLTAQVLGQVAGVRVAVLGIGLQQRARMSASSPRTWGLRPRRGTRARPIKGIGVALEPFVEEDGQGIEVGATVEGRREG